MSFSSTSVLTYLTVLYHASSLFLLCSNTLQPTSFPSNCYCSTTEYRNSGKKQEVVKPDSLMRQAETQKKTTALHNDTSSAPQILYKKQLKLLIVIPLFRAFDTSIKRRRWFISRSYLNLHKICFITTTLWTFRSSSINIFPCIITTKNIISLFPLNFRTR
jgi:hypothetical protein